MIDKKSEFIEDALKEMFTYVGKEYSEDFCKQDAWYTKYQWTEQQELDFMAWFVNEYRKRFRSNKRTAKEEFGFFNLMWGWKRKKV